VVYDYGAFVYSTDGVNFTTVEVHSSSYWGPRASGTYGEKLSDLDDAQFYIGWIWNNDGRTWYRF
jgi:hypothetical protein